MLPNEFSLGQILPPKNIGKIFQVFVLNSEIMGKGLWTCGMIVLCFKGHAPRPGPRATAIHKIHLYQALTKKNEKKTPGNLPHYIWFFLRQYGLLFYEILKSRSNFPGFFNPFNLSLQKESSKCTKNLNEDNMEICVLKGANSKAKFRKIPLWINYWRSQNFCLWHIWRAYEL